MTTKIGTVDLPNPKFNDTLETEPHRAFNRRASGVYGAYQANRPLSQTYSWNYELRATKALELVAYLQANIGLHVSITDYLTNVLADCVVLNPEATIKEIRDHYTDTTCSVKSIEVRFLHVNP